MKKVKKIIYLCVYILLASSFTTTLSAQYLDLKGIAVGAYTYQEEGEGEEFKCDELYSFSFSDKMLCHSIYTEGYLDDSQFYELSGIEKFMKGNSTIFKSKATSGVSGNVYGYEIEISEEGKLVKMVRTQPEGAFSEFHGSVVVLKTFKQ